MTITPTDDDFAEAMRLMGRPERIIAAALVIKAFTKPERNFAQTIAKLRVAVEALGRNRQGWENALELGLIPERHTQTAHDLVNATNLAISQIKGTDHD